LGCGYMLLWHAIASMIRRRPSNHFHN